MTNSGSSLSMCPKRPVNLSSSLYAIESALHGNPGAPSNVWRWTASALVVLTVVLGMTRVLDRHAATPVDDAFRRALVTFAVVRGINAVVSVVQGTEIAIEPAGVGVVLAPGQVFDPINDLVERFSWIMLASSTSLGAQKVLIEMSAAGVTQALALLAVLVLAALLWRSRRGDDARWRSVALRISVLVLFARFAVPVMVLVNDAVYQSFLAQRFEASQIALEQTREQVEALRDADRAPASDATQEGLLNRLGRWYDRTTESFDVEARIALYRDRLSRASEHIIDLIVVFVLQTVVFPLLFMWLGLALVRAAIRGRD